ncbi:hypothetical protein M4R22_19025 [Acidovorax sp. GBBC 3334]|uniref:hypothetical protein n=1 Tax=Acidovorax sp. GBBC 3334 TaxID=2940496 RepID=UPI0023030491|nr:hypothetical protein [Acidovorax sp. GBBC 3334]MDA8456858.1 hypothetical protein [Acidovorax sp. GBBC 3334]
MPLVITTQPAGPLFFIGADATMPTITVAAALQGINLPKGTLPAYEWIATLAFNGGIAPTKTSFGGGRKSEHPVMRAQTGHANTWRIPFTLVRGGVLTVQVTARAGGATYQGKLGSLLIVGTNPTPTAIRSFADSIGANKVRFRKQLRQESSLQQFRPPDLWPKYSSDGLGGVGLAQITRPAPTGDQTWNWKENVRAGWALYKEKERIARAYPGIVRGGETFRRLVGDYNRARAAQRLPALQVALPDFTDEQLEQDAIRGFNGYANGLHEFRVRTEGGRLFVALSPDGLQGLAEWERVPTADRGRVGDPAYVEHIEASQDF